MISMGEEYAHNSNPEMFPDRRLFTDLGEAVKP